MMLFDSLFMLTVSFVALAMANSYQKESKGDGGTLRLLYGTEIAKGFCKVLSIISFFFAMLAFAFGIFLAVRDVYLLLSNF